MAGIGDLVAHLGLDNSGFKRGLASSRSMLSSFAGGLAGLISPIGAAFAGIAGTAGVGLLVKNSFEGVDAVSKLGQKLGITASEAAGFQHAAELSGVSAEGMESALKRLSRSGVDIYAVADSIAATNDPAERSRIAFEAMGKSGQDLIPMLQGGSASLRQMVEEGSRLSGLEGLDASKVEAANDAISRSKAAFVGIANIVAVEVAPAVEWAAVKMQGLAEWVLSGKDYFVALGQYGSAAFTAIGVGISNIGKVGEITFLSLELGVVQFGMSAWHLFTEQIPTALNWFGENASKVFFTIGDYAATVFINLGENIRSVMQEAWDYIKSGGTDAFDPVIKRLDEGFVSIIDKLPEIPERAATELEKSLQANIGRLSEELGQEFGAAMAEKTAAELNKVGAPAIGEGLASAVKPPPALKAAFAGSQEAASIMLRGVGGPGNDVQQKQLTIQQQILAATKANKPPALMPLSL